jgi:hypothetical protein
MPLTRPCTLPSVWAILPVTIMVSGPTCLIIDGHVAYRSAVSGSGMHPRKITSTRLATCSNGGSASGTITDRRISMSDLWQALAIFPDRLIT